MAGPQIPLQGWLHSPLVSVLNISGYTYTSALLSIPECLLLKLDSLFCSKIRGLGWWKKHILTYASRSAWGADDATWSGQSKFGLIRKHNNIIARQIVFRPSTSSSSVAGQKKIQTMGNVRSVLSRTLSHR